MVSALVAGLLALAAPSGAVSIQHDAVACVVARQHPRLDACVTPSAKVGRAQVHFRAAGKGPWYAVDLRPNGSCLSGLLPRPLPTTKAIEYFVYAIDREFAERTQPERAPEVPHAVRVVANEGGCDNGLMAAWADRAQPVRISVVRDSGGQLVTAAGAPAQGPPIPEGFSPDGVLTSGEPGETGSKASPSRAKGIGKGTIVAVAAGVAAAGATVAAVAGGGGNGTGSANQGANPANGTSPSTPSANVSGSWSGPWASISTFSVPEVGTVSVSCVHQVTATLSQSGEVVTGTATSSGGSCSSPGFQVAGEGSTGPVTGVALNGLLTLTIRLSDNFCSPGQFTGTYAGAALSGTYRMSCVAQGTPIEYTATWTARR